MTLQAVYSDRSSTAYEARSPELDLQPFKDGRIQRAADPLQDPKRGITCYSLLRRQEESQGHVQSLEVLSRVLCP